MLKPPPAPDKHPRGRRFVFYWLPLVLYCGAIVCQSAFPSVQKADPFPHFDKVLHMGAYAVMAWLFARALVRERPGLSPAALWWAALAFTVFFGLTDELHQAFVPSRTADILDLLADAIGAGFGVMIFLGCSRRSKK